MNTLGFATLAVTGFVACAEFGSYAFVHPVVRRLPPTAHLQVEQGLLRTFGRVMPVGMTLCVVLAITNATRAGGGDDGSQLWHWLAATAFVLALASTIVFNVPINLATGKWDAENPTGVEADPQPMGVLPRAPVLASTDRIRAGLRWSLGGLTSPASPDIAPGTGPGGSDPQVDRLIELLSTEADHEAAASLANEIVALLSAGAPVGAAGKRRLSSASTSGITSTPLTRKKLSPS